MSKFLTKLKDTAWWVLEELHLTTATRLVMLLSPLFASASGLILTYAAKWGLPIRMSNAELVGVFVTGATLVSAKLLVWLHGSQKAALLKTHIVSQAAQASNDQIHEVTLNHKGMIGGEPVIHVYTPQAPPPVRTVLATQGEFVASGGGGGTAATPKSAPLGGSVDFTHAAEGALTFTASALGGAHTAADEGAPEHPLPDGLREIGATE